MLTCVDLSVPVVFVGKLVLIYASLFVMPTWHRAFSCIQDQASKDSRAAEGGEGTDDPESKPLVPVMNKLPPRFRSVSHHCICTVKYVCVSLIITQCPAGSVPQSQASSFDGNVLSQQTKV